MCVYTHTHTHTHTHMSHFAVTLKLRQHCKSTDTLIKLFFFKKNQLGNTKRLVQNSPGTNPIPPSETEDDTLWYVHTIGPSGHHLVRGAMDVTGPIGPDMALQINQLPATPKRRDNFSKTIVNENSQCKGLHQHGHLFIKLKTTKLLRLLLGYA